MINILDFVGSIEFDEMWVLVIPKGLEHIDFLLERYFVRREEPLHCEQWFLNLQQLVYDLIISVKESSLHHAPSPRSCDALDVS